MSRTIIIADQKGGVGKSTTSNFIAYELAIKGNKVLLIDWDSQASQTNSFFGLKDVHYAGDNEHNIINIFKGKSITPIVITDSEKKMSFDFIPSNEELLDIVESDEMKYIDKISVLPNFIKSVQDKYDYVLVDCPPSFGILTKSALLSADSILVPIATKSVDEDGIKRFFEKANALFTGSKANKLSNIFILPTIYDSRMNNAKEMLTIIRLLPRFLSMGHLTYFKNIHVDILDAVPYKVEIIEAPGQKMFLKEYINTYIKSTSINPIITILENMVLKISK